MSARWTRVLVGRPFAHAGVELALVGGLVSLVATAVLWALPGPRAVTTGLALAGVLLATNGTHFAASTVRLYTKPGSRESWPFLTLVFPLVSLVALGACIALPRQLGTHLQSLYLTWSPYHYAAQAYGLAVVYALRAGCRLDPGDKRLLWWAAMLPFFYACISSPGAGVFWFFTREQVQGVAPLAAALRALAVVLPVLGVAAPLAVFARIAARRGGPLPLIGLLALLANAAWWFALTAMEAFFWATVFHGLQYLVIVVLFHVRDQVQRPANRHGALYHGLWFYGACLVLGYALFHALPRAFGLAGFGRVESMLLTIAAINVHHFVVDGFIWKLRPGDSNRRVVETEAAGARAAPSPSPA